MPISSKRTANNAIRRIESEVPDIDTKVDGKDSQTVKMVQIIVDEVLKEIKNNGIVLIVNLPVATPTGPGTGNGKGQIV